MGTLEQAQAVKRFMTGEDGLAVRGSVISNDPPIIDPPNDPPIDRAVLASLQTVMERWEEKLKHHQDTNGQVKQPRWAKCFELWQELAQALKQSD